LVVALGAMTAGGAALLVAAQWHSLVLAAVPMFVFMSAVGVVLPNTMALAMDLHPERAGAASALMGAGQSAFGAIVAPLVGLAGDRSAVPVAVAMTGAAAGALLVLVTATRGAARTWAVPAQPAAVLTPDD